MVNAYSLPGIRTRAAGPGLQTMNNRARRGMQLTRPPRRSSFNPTIQRPAGGRASGGSDRFSPMGIGDAFNTGFDANAGFGIYNTRDRDRQPLDDFMQSYADGGDVFYDPEGAERDALMAYQASEEERKRQEAAAAPAPAPQLGQQLGNVMRGAVPLPPIAGPAAPPPTPVGPIIGPPSAFQPVDQDSPYQQFLRSQAEAVKQDVAQNGAPVNYENGLPYRGMTIGDVALNSALTAPVLGGLPASFAKNLASIEGQQYAPQVAEKLGVGETGQRIAGTVAGLAPFTGANPWVLGGGVGGSELGHGTGYDVELPIVGSLDTAIGMGVGAGGRALLGRGLEAAAGLPGMEFKGGVPNAISSSRPGEGSPAALAEQMREGGGSARLTPDQMAARLREQGFTDADIAEFTKNNDVAGIQAARDQAIKDAARNNFASAGGVPGERPANPEAVRTARFGAAMEGDVQRGNRPAEVEPGTAPLEEPVSPALAKEYEAAARISGREHVPPGAMPERTVTPETAPVAPEADLRATEEAVRGAKEAGEGGTSPPARPAAEGAAVSPASSTPPFRLEPTTPEQNAAIEAAGGLGELTNRNLADKAAREAARAANAAESVRTPPATPTTSAVPPAEVAKPPSMLSEITLADLVDALQERAKGATPGPIPREGVLTPAETARAAGAEVETLRQSWEKYNALSDADLIAAADRANVRAPGTAPLDATGKLSQAYRDRLTGDLAVAEHPEAGALASSEGTPVGQLMSQRQQVADAGIAEAARQQGFMGQGGTNAYGKAPGEGQGAGLGRFSGGPGMSGTGAPPGGGTTGTPRAGGGGGKPSILQRILGIPNELGYLKFGGDEGTIGRQDIGNVINPIYWKETLKVLDDTRKATLSQRGADAVLNELHNLPDLQKFPNLKIETPDMRPGANVNREFSISKLTDWGPMRNLNRGNSMELTSRRYRGTADAIRNYGIKDAAQAQTMANFLTRNSGRGYLPEWGAKFGPLFTSLRMMASIPQRGAYLLPWTRLADGRMEMFGPVWQEAVKRHAGWAAGTVGVMGALSQVPGVQVGWDPRKLTGDPDGPAFAHFRVFGTDHDLTGGASRYLGLLVGLKSGEKNPGLPNAREYPRIFGETSPALRLTQNGKTLAESKAQYGGTVADFARNSLGPGVGIISELAKVSHLIPKDSTGGQILDYTHPDFFDKGPLGTGSPIDKFLGQMSFLWMQSTADAMRGRGDEGLKSAAVTAPTEFIGLNATTPQNTAQYQRHDVLNDDATLAKALPPSIAPMLKGEDYRDLAPREKAAVNGARDPATVKADADAARARGDVYQLAQDKRDEIRDSYNGRFDALLNELKSGNRPPIEVRKDITNLEKQMRNEMNSLKIEGGDGSPPPQSPIQKAVAEYKDLYNKVGTVNGQPDYDQLKVLQAQYVRNLAAQDKDLATRLVYNVKQQANPDDHPALRMYDNKQVVEARNAYYANPEWKPGMERNERAIWLQENPKQDALLYAVGITPTVKSAEAAYTVKNATGRNPDVDIDLGFQPKGQPGFTSRDVRQYADVYFNLDPAAKAQWREDHPDADYALYMAGYLPNVRSLQAYERVTQRSGAALPSGGR